MSRFFQPIHDRVLVQLDVHEGKTASGLYVPETGARVMTGTVLDIGEDAEFVKIGSRVHFSKFATSEEIAPGWFVVPEKGLLGMWVESPEKKVRKSNKRK